MKIFATFALVFVSGVAAYMPALGLMDAGCPDGICGGDGHGLIDQHWNYAPYQFGYNFHDEHTGSEQSREEVADGHGGVKGSYSFIDGHGIKRIVEYVADKGGFRAMIKTNEPGTKTSNPADALYMSSAPEFTHAVSSPLMAINSKIAHDY